MSELGRLEGKKLIAIARKALELFLQGRRIDNVEGLSEGLRRRAACFVSLHLDGELRGCIGTLEARRELWREVADKAVSAASEDWRFAPLTKEELAKARISVSVLSEMKEASASDVKPGAGLVIEKQGRSATFLPVVWEQLPDKNEFLSRLCEKAGLRPNEWKEPGMKFWVYTAQEFEE